jgi:hypothetical protein
MDEGPTINKTTALFDPFESDLDLANPDIWHFSGLAKSMHTLTTNIQDLDMIPLLDTGNSSKFSMPSLVVYQATHGEEITDSTKNKPIQMTQDDNIYTSSNDCPPPLLSCISTTNSYNDETSYGDLDKKTINMMTSTEEVYKVIHQNCPEDQEERLVNSGATVNITRNEKYTMNARPSNALITVRNGEKVKVKTQGDLLYLKVETTGKLSKFSQALVCPELPKNIISTKLLERGHSVTMDQNNGFISTKCTDTMDEAKKIDLAHGLDGMFYLKGK